MMVVRVLRGTSLLNSVIFMLKLMFFLYYNKAHTTVWRPLYYRKWVSCLPVPVITQVTGQLQQYRYLCWTQRSIKCRVLQWISRLMWYQEELYIFGKKEWLGRQRLAEIS